MKNLFFRMAEMYRYKIVLPFILLLSIGNYTLLAQNNNCNPLTKISAFDQIKTCAPVDVEWHMTVKGVTASTVEFVYDWGDGSPRVIINATETSPTEFTADQTVYYTYPQGGNNCSYTPEVFLRIDGVTCASSIVSNTVIVHDVDIYNGGILDIDPILYRVCAGNQATVSFQDVSQWNCTPPDEMENVNDQNRWIQWVYGTLDDPRPRIGNAVVGTSPPTTVNSPTLIYGDVAYYPGPVTGSGDISLPVTVPATAAVGEVFEVTLRNWNRCNPYDADPGNGVLNPADLNNGDNAPVTQTAHILVVPAPEPDFTTHENTYNGTQRTEFCPGYVYFNASRRGTVGTQNPGGGNLRYSWEIFDAGVSIHGPTSPSSSATFSYNFEDAGNYRIVLTVEDITAAGDCEASEFHDITIREVPQADIAVYVDGSGSPTTDLDLCEVVGGDYDFSIANLTIVPGGSTPEYTWSLKKIIPSAVILTQNTDNRNDRFEFSLDEPGSYEVTLTALDAVTSCFNVHRDTINIYNAPRANFEIVGNQELCVGRLTEFSDLSGFVSPLGFADDDIVGWEWWFDYNGDPSSASQSNDQNPTHIFSVVKDYDVRLEVQTKYGCFHDTTFTLTVNPIAKAEITVDNPADCGPHEPTFTNVHANDQLPVVVEKYRWYATYEGSLIDSPVDQFPDINGVFIDTFAYAFPYTRTDNQDQIYKVFMEAYAVGGCVTTDSLEITVFPSASAKFISDYNPLASNCSPVLINFEADAATKALPFSKEYSWSVMDDEGVVVVPPTLPNAAADTFFYSFTNADSIAIKTYEVIMEVTALAGPCLQPYKQQIKLNPTPSSKFTTTRSEECEHVVLNLDANQKGLGASNYFWTFINTTTGASKTYENNPALDDNFGLQFLRGTADSTVEITLRTRNFAGCESTGPAQQFLIPAKNTFVVALDTVSAMPKCAPQTITFENNSTVPAGSTFQLQIQKGSNAAFTVPASDITGNLNDAQFSYTFAEAGDYIVTLLGEYTDGCKDQASINITIYPTVEASFAPNTSSVCPGQQVLLNEGSTPKTIIAQRNWTVRDLADNSIIETLTGTQLFYIFDSAGTYEIELEVISAKGCSDIAKDTITVLPEPKFELSYNKTSCNQTFTFGISAIDPSISITSFTWNWGDGKTTVTTVPDTSHVYSNRNGYLGQDKYEGTVTALASTGCTYTDTFSVTLLHDVSASFLMDKNIGCGPLTVVFDDLSLGAVAAASEWHYREKKPSLGPWKKFDGISNVFYNSSADTMWYEVKLDAKSLDGCTDSWTRVVTVFPEVAADFVIEQASDCGPSSVKFTNSDIRNNVRYIWEWGDGTANDTTTAAALWHTFDNSSFSIPRNFKVRLTAKNLTSDCSSFLEKTVTVQPAVRAEITPSDTVGCSPLAIEFSNDYQGVSNHNWYVVNMNTDQVVPGYSGNSPDFKPIPFVNNTIDTIRFKVMYNGLSSQGCPVEDSAFVLVYPEILPSFTASPEVQNLPNKTVTLNNTTFNNPGYIYSWDFGNGITSSERDPEPIEYETYGIYTISLTVSDQFGKCGNTTIQVVEIKPTIPIIDFTYDPAEGCGPLTIQFTSKSQYVDKGTYLWDFGDNSSSFSSEENPTYTYYEPGEYTVTLQGSNAIGVTVTETKKYIIRVYENPRANFRIRQRMPVYMPDSVIFLNESSDAVSYHWDFGDGTTSTEFEPKHAYAAPGNYTIKLVAVSELGCADTLIREGEIEIAGQFEVKIPNVFTPNGDQDNEVFLPLMQGVVEYNLLIFNRWGELLFESKSQEEGWDGYYKGVISPPDVYIYKLDLKFVNGERTTKTGDVTLLR